MSIKLNSVGGGSVTIQEPNTASDFTLSVPAQTANLLTNRTAGTVLQVVQATKTDSYSASVSSGGESGDVTGLSCSITPSNTSNKILVTFAVNVGCIANQFVGYQGYVNGSLVAVGDASGSRKRTTAQSREIRSDDMVTIGMSFLHSPSSVSQQTYTIRLWHGSGGSQTLCVNRNFNDVDANYSGRGVSTITAQEISA
jgi:hypothetical protein